MRSRALLFVMIPLLATGALLLTACGSSDTSAAPQTKTVTVAAQPASSDSPGTNEADDPSATSRYFTGVFSTMDERQRCRATATVVVCASTGSGQRVRLDRSGASYEGEVATTFPLPHPIGLGSQVKMASGAVCKSTSRGIECSRGGHGFVIGDSAVVVLRGSGEQRYAPTPPEDEGEDASTVTVAQPTPETVPESASSGQVCWPDLVIPPTTIPATEIGGVYLPAQTIPGQTIPGACFDASLGAYPPPADTNVLADGYADLDPDFSQELSESYWDSFPPVSSGSGYSSSYVPDFTAPGHGGLNEAGYPKNQYVRPYVRKDGTPVRGHWRNSPTDGLHACSIIDC